MSLEALIKFYETLSVDEVARFADFYSEDAWFKDPFNEVRGRAAIQGIFQHMFTQLSEPRFRVSQHWVDANGEVMLLWELWFRSRLLGRGDQVLRGVSHLRFDGSGRVNYHRDYWDAAEELYAKVPLLGGLMRGLKGWLAA